MLRNTAIAYVSLGSNLGDSVSHIGSSMTEMSAPGVTEILARSSLYETLPIGYLEQPHFVNCVVSMRTRLPPLKLLARLQAIEDAHGRTRLHPNGPRTLDLDLLLHGDSEMCESQLQLPHPRLHEREFVLRPLVEIAPNIWIPGHGSGQNCLAQCGRQGVTLLASSDWSSAGPSPAKAEKG